MYKEIISLAVSKFFGPSKCIFLTISKDYKILLALSRPNIPRSFALENLPTQQNSLSSLVSKYNKKHL